jgi:hypothetical protein
MSDRPFWPEPHLRDMTTAAYLEHQRFAHVLAFAMHARRDELLKGQETNVYCIARPDGSAWKIGKAKDPEDRLKTLQQGSSERLYLYAWAPAPAKLEKYLHGVLKREQIAGEWFYGRRTLTVVSLIESAMEMGWDMADVGDPPDAESTIYMLTDHADMALHDAKAAA